VEAWVFPTVVGSLDRQTIIACLSSRQFGWSIGV
jgi:hypothetical protein